jgi:GR25 family glycosyltransferase involved in LPS biosynthesis
MWTNFFSRIVLINLASRPDRLVESSLELKRHKIPFEVVEGIKNENGQQGISDTLRGLFRETLEQSNGPLLVFEDDVRMVVEPAEFERIMDLALIELPSHWDMLYLGANLPSPRVVSEFSAHLLRTKRALALHAVAYSRRGMEEILSLPPTLPIDLQIADEINTAGGSFVTYPLLCTQKESYSNIERKVVCYSRYIEDRYAEVEKYLGLSEKSVS